MRTDSSFTAVSNSSRSRALRSSDRPADDPERSAAYAQMAHRKNLVAGAAGRHHGIPGGQGRDFLIVADLIERHAHPPAGSSTGPCATTTPLSRRSLRNAPWRFIRSASHRRPGCGMGADRPVCRRTGPVSCRRIAAHPQGNPGLQPTLHRPDARTGRVQGGAIQRMDDVSCSVPYRLSVIDAMLLIPERESCTILFS
jgi:hypothetical protein